MGRRMGPGQRQGSYLDEVGPDYMAFLRKTEHCREPTDVKDQEYMDFYKAISKDDSAETLGWAHFKVSCVLRCVVTELS